jgi:hypothetical protein
MYREPALHSGQPLTERTLDLSDLPGGIYSVHMLAPGGLVTRKLIR